MKAYANFVAERVKRFDHRNESLDGFRYHESLEKCFTALPVGVRTAAANRKRRYPNVRYRDVGLWYATPLG